MRTIRKYQLIDNTLQQTIPMPFKPRLLGSELHGNFIFIYAVVDEANPNWSKIEVTPYLTEQLLPMGRMGKYLGTHMLPIGMNVHVFGKRIVESPYFPRPPELPTEPLPP